MPIVPGDTPKKFYKNGKTWLPQFYDAVAGDAGNMSRYDTCYWLMKLHRFHEPKAFDDVCRTSRVAAFKMDPHRQIAMFQKNNLTYEHGRGMRPYFNADRCNPLNSERVIRRLEVNPSLTPKYTTFLEENTQRHAWCLPVMPAVQAEIAKNDTKAEEVHVILSADHGQEAFRVNIAALQIKRGKVSAESSVLVGHVECRKDTTAVLKDSTVLSNVNASLKQLKESDPKIRLLATGDLAWYSLALGKPSMAGEHCWRCKSRRKDHQKDPLHVGEPWTLHEMKERYT